MMSLSRSHGKPAIALYSENCRGEHVPDNGAALRGKKGDNLVYTIRKLAEKFSFCSDGTRI